jgi:hypothetical protein
MMALSLVGVSLLDTAAPVRAGAASVFLDYQTKDSAPEQSRQVTAAQGFPVSIHFDAIDS